MAPISNDWLEPLKPEFRKPYYAKLYKTVMDEYHTRRIYPPADDIFNAFALTPLKDVKVVILGQDPWGWTGTWTLFFGETRCRDTAVSCKYL